MRGHRSLVVCSKNLPLQEKLQRCSLAGGPTPASLLGCPGVQPQDADPSPPWLGLSPLPPARPPVVGRPEPEPDGRTHFPAAPGIAHACGRLGTAVFPVAFNWECSCQAERIRAGERNCPSVRVGQQYICVLLRLTLYFPGC